MGSHIELKREAFSVLVEKIHTCTSWTKSIAVPRLAGHDAAAVSFIVPATKSFTEMCCTGGGIPGGV